ncbi:MAG: LacI family DNA-binding transcriptional regulator, partial [Candidatus Atribacteria bacterium]|nr:LacI family DNA-binding transcriptional regulator [Candidatus Atribacteria bacterium]
MYHTLRDIAEIARVSVKTVSRVINEETSVSVATREKVKKVINELRYQPNYIARSLKQNRTRIIGYIVPDISNQFYGMIGKVIEKYLRKHGYSLLISSTNNAPELEVQTLNLLASQKVDGIIFATLGETKEFVKDYLTRFKIPIVAIDNKVTGLDLDVVLHDNITGAYLLTRHLIEHGHQRIACIGGPLNQTSGALRYEGYQRALREKGIEVDINLVRFGNWQFRSGFELTSDLIEQRFLFTAVFSANSYMALGILRALRKHNLRVPRQVALVSFDDFDFTEFTE